MIPDRVPIRGGFGHDERFVAKTPPEHMALLHAMRLELVLTGHIPKVRELCRAGVWRSQDSPAT